MYSGKRNGDVGKDWVDARRAVVLRNLVLDFNSNNDNILLSYAVTRIDMTLRAVRKMDNDCLYSIIL